MYTFGWRWSDAGERNVLGCRRTFFPIDLNNGNDGRGTKWFKSNVLRKKYEELIRRLGHVREPFDRQVRVVYTRVLGKGQRLFDTLSLGRGNAKEIEDASSPETTASSTAVFPWGQQGTN